MSEDALEVILSKDKFTQKEVKDKFTQDEVKEIDLIMNKLGDVCEGKEMKVVFTSILNFLQLFLVLGYKKHGISKDKVVKLLDAILDDFKIVVCDNLDKVYRNE